MSASRPDSASTPADNGGDHELVVLVAPGVLAHQRDVGRGVAQRLLRLAGHRGRVERLAADKVPTRVIVVDDLPRSMLGKVRRKQVQDAVANQW